MWGSGYADEAMSSTNAAWNPALYDSAASFVSAASMDLVELLAARPGERVLDLGCGTGRLAARIAATGAVVTGVDSSVEMIERARELWPGLDFRVVDGQKLPFDGCFEAVLSNAALHWMVRADDVARGIARALVSGGRLLLEMGGNGNVATVRAGIDRALAELRIDAQAAPAWYFPRLGEYASLLEAHGLHVTWARLFDRPTVMTDTEDKSALATWLEIFAPELLRAIPEEARISFVHQVEDFCRPTLASGKAWTLDYVRLRMTAEKLPRKEAR